MNPNIKNLIELYKSVDHNQLFHEYHDELQSIVNGYLALKDFVDIEGNFTENADFRSKYSYFYGMNRFASRQDYQDRYFNAMKNAYLEPNNIVLKDLLLSLENVVAGKARIEMSFVSKLMNFVDESKYPIFDSGIRAAFGFIIPVGREEKLVYYPQMYKTIIEGYDHLSSHPSIDKFRSEFNCPSLSNYRVLDIIVITIARHKK